MYINKVALYILGNIQIYKFIIEMNNSLSQRPNIGGTAITPGQIVSAAATSHPSMQASSAALQTSSFKMTQKKAMSKQAMALRHQQQQQLQTQNTSIRDVVIDKSGESTGGVVGSRGVKQLQLQLLPQSSTANNNVLGMSHDGARPIKMPQRPETSTGSKSKQIILMQYGGNQNNNASTIKTKTLQQVYGHPQVLLQQRRSEFTQESSGSNTRGKSQQLRASSQTKVFGRGVAPQGQQQFVGSGASGASQNPMADLNGSQIRPQADQTPTPTHAIYQNIMMASNSEYEQPNVLTHGATSDDGPMSTSSGAKPQFKTFLSNNEPSSAAGTVTDVSPLKNRKQIGQQQQQQQQIANMQNKLIINQAKINKKGEPMIIPSKLDLKQLMYFNGSQQFTENRMNSAALSDLPSGHVIQTGHQAPAENTPSSISFKAPSVNQKKLRNLKNFSAQSTMLDQQQQAAFNSITQNHAGFADSRDDYNKRPTNEKQMLSQQPQDLPEFQQNFGMFIHMNEQQQANMQRQLSSKNVRRNTQTAGNSKSGGQNAQITNFHLVQTADRAGSRYKQNKQQQQIANHNTQNQILQKQLNGARMTVTTSGKGTNVVGNASRVLVGKGQVAQNALLQSSVGQERQSSGAQSANDKRISSYHSSNQNRAVNMVNRSRQSFKEMSDKSFEQKESLNILQQYQSQQKPQGQNFNLLRHSVQQDNFIANASGGAPAQGNTSNAVIRGQALKQQMNNLHLTHGHGNLQKNSQVQQALSKSNAIQKQMSQKYQQQLLQQQSNGSNIQNSSIGNREALMQLAYQQHQTTQNVTKMQKHMLLRNQQQTNKTPQITSQKNSNFSRKLTINSNHMSISNGNGITEVDLLNHQIDLPQQIQQLKQKEEIKSQKGTLIQPSQSPTFTNDFQVQNFKQSLNQQIQSSKRNDRYVKSGKAQRTNTKNLEMINAAINYIEAPLKIGSVHGASSPHHDVEDAVNKEYAESQLTSGTNMSQNLGIQDQFPIQFNPQYQESRFTPSTFNNEGVVGSTLDGFGAPSSCSRQMRLSGQCSPQKMMGIPMNMNMNMSKNKTESRQSKRCLVQKGKGGKQNSIYDGQERTNRNTSIARRNDNFDQEDIQHDFQQIQMNQIAHAQSVQENHGTMVNNSTVSHPQKMANNKNRDALVQSSVSGKQSIFQIYNQPIKVVSAGVSQIAQGNILNSKNLNKTKKNSNQQQLIQKIQAQELQKYLAQQQQLAMHNQQLNSQQSQDNMGFANPQLSNDVVSQHSKSFNSAQRTKKKLVCAIVANQSSHGARQPNIVLANKTKKDIFQKLKQQQLKSQNNNPKQSVFDSNNPQFNQQQMLRIQNMQKNISEYQQKQKQRESIRRNEIQSQNLTRESEKNDDFFHLNMSHNRECSTSPTRALENHIRSPVNIQNLHQSGGGYNIQELYDSEVRSSLNSRSKSKGPVHDSRANPQTKNNKQQRLVVQTHSKNRSDWRRRSSNKNQNIMQFRQSNMESQYKSNASGHNATFTSSVDSGSQQIADQAINAMQLHKNGTSSHVVSKKHLQQDSQLGDTAIIDRQARMTHKVKNRTVHNQSNIDSPKTGAENHIKIQNNNFKPQNNNGKDEPELFDEQKKRKALSNHNNSLRNTNSKNTMISNSQGNKGSNTGNGSSSNGQIKNSQSQKRLKQMRQQMNINRLKELPSRIHETMNESAKSIQQLQQSHKQSNDDSQIIQQRGHGSQERAKVTSEKENSPQRKQHNTQQMQIKKPPQVPSLGTKIQYAQQKQISQLPDGPIFSGEVLAGASAGSTVGGTASNVPQNNGGGDGRERNGIDYHQSSNKMFNPAAKNKQEIYRKNSSILSTANRNYLQINTPSALGYTSVLLGGTQTAGGTHNGRMHPAHHSFTLYGNLQYHEDPDIFAQQLLFDSDRDLLNQFKLNEAVKLSIDPLGMADNPFMVLPYDGPLYDQNYFTEDVIEPEIQMDSAEKNLIIDTTTQDDGGRGNGEEVGPDEAQLLSGDMQRDQLLNSRSPQPQMQKMQDIFIMD